MTRYNALLSTAFAGCQLLHQGVDPHRGRPAKYFKLPGVFDLIGYHDAVDSFVIPVSQFVPRPVHDALAAILAGKPFTVAPQAGARPRRSFAAEPASADQTRARRTFHAE